MKINNATIAQMKYTNDTIIHKCHDYFGHSDSISLSDPVKAKNNRNRDTFRILITVIIWRSRRDLNPRYPFGVHTISSRARYDHFDTAPYLVVSQSTCLYYPKDRHLSRVIFTFLQMIFRVAIFDRMHYNKSNGGVFT